MVSETPSYIALTKALTTLLDTAFTKPYSPGHISTQSQRLLSLPAGPVTPGASFGLHYNPVPMNRT